MNTINNTKKLNFWFTNNNTGFICEHNMILKITFKNIIDYNNECLVIKYRDYDYNNYTYSSINDEIQQLTYFTNILESNTSTHFIIPSTIYKNIYIICKDRNGNYIEGIDNIELLFGGLHVIEKTKKEVFTKINQLNYSNICNNVYVIPGTIQNSYKSIGYGRTGLGAVDLKFTKLCDCSVKIIIECSNIGKTLFGFFGNKYAL
jgi:hypothetical protein